jgi:hypothetical protein
MQAKLFDGSIISTTLMWVSATQGEVGYWPDHRRQVGTVIVTFSKDCTVTTYNAEVIITNEIDKYYSGIPARP